MIEVTLVTNDGAGLPVRVPVVEGTTLEKFLEVSFDGNPDEFTIRVRANGTTVEAHRDYVLQDGDRVSLAPTKVEGETKGPGTNEEQIATLRGKLSNNDVAVAEKMAEQYSVQVLTLACKLRREQENQNRLPKAVAKALDGLSKEDAELVRSKLTGRK